MDNKKQNLYYAAWWRRFTAYLIDVCVLFPLVIMASRIMTKSPPLYALILVPLGVVSIGYFIICHGLWGMTLGKLATGTRVTALDGSRISWRQAFLRNIVDIVYIIITSFALISAYLHVPIAGYAEMSSAGRLALIKSLRPIWFPYLTSLENVWIYSEFIVILLNKRRRALHDFIAGTIVIQKTPTRSQARDENPYDFDYDKEMKQLSKL